MPIVSNTDPTALFSGDFWTGFAQNPTPTPVIVTYSFPTALTGLPPSDMAVPNFTAASNASFVAFSPAEQAQAVAAMGEWAAASGIVFVQVAPGTGDINFSNIDFLKLATPSTVGGIGYNPFGNWDGNSAPNYMVTHTGNFTTDLTYAGDVFMNTQYQATDGTVSYGTLLHEIGHAIGLKHPTQVDDDFATTVHEDNVLSADDPTLTIMSTQVDAQTASDPHLLALDKAAAAAIYGPAGTGEVVTATSGIVTGSNSVSNWSWNASTQTLTQTAATANDVIHGTSVNDVITAGNGTDSLFGLDGNNTLTGGTMSTSVDYLYGGPDTDTLNGGAGTNYLYAGTGTEALNGGSGTNTFYDGGGADTIMAKGATDTFNVSSTNTTITEANTHSVGRINTTVSYTMPQYVDTMYLTGAGLTGTANNDANTSMFGDGTHATTLIAGSGADYMVGGSGNDTFNVGMGPDYMFGNGGANNFVFNSIADTNSAIGDFKVGTDKVDLSGIARTFGNSLSFIGTGPFTGHAGQVESYVDPNFSNTTYVMVDTTGSGSANFEIVLYNTPALQASDLNLSNAPCYCAGTRIMTERGEVAVEDLAIGDRVMTVSGLARPIKWIGNRSYAGMFAFGNRKVLPVCFKAGSLAEGIPKRDLWVSPNHAMFIDDMLIPAADLVNGNSIAQADAVEELHYFHVELESHDVILAEGAGAETFLDDDSRMIFHNAQDYFARYPDDIGPTQFCAPRVTEGYALEAVRQRIDKRAGIAITNSLPVPVANQAAIDRLGCRA
jgi:Ca2+-binding RTX toxin-like protein